MTYKPSPNADLAFRVARPDDWPAIWALLEPIFRAGETYPFPPDISEQAAKRVWTEVPEKVFLAVDAGSGQALGTYYLKTNQVGLGDHVCNCGYAVSEAARGRGVASAMCAHSQEQGRAMGYRAMQFNYVVASNTGAVALWRRLGFVIVGTLPEAFRHLRLGFVDAHVMWKSL